MLFPLLCIVAGAALADNVQIFYTPNQTPTDAQPVTYGYAAPTPSLPVTVYLMEGPATNLQTVTAIATTTGGSFAWIPVHTPATDYALEIVQGTCTSGCTNYLAITIAAATSLPSSIVMTTSSSSSTTTSSSSTTTSSSSTTTFSSSTTTIPVASDALPSSGSNIPPTTATYVGSAMSSSTSSSYNTAAYSMPPSVPYSAPLTTNTNTAYFPAMGGPSSNTASSNSDYLTVDPNGATCRVPNTVYVTEQATITVLSSGLPDMAAMGASSTLPESLQTLKTDGLRQVFSSAAFLLPKSSAVYYSSAVPMKREDSGYKAAYHG